MTLEGTVRSEGNQSQKATRNSVSRKCPEEANPYRQKVDGGRGGEAGALRGRGGLLHGSRDFFQDDESVLK